VFVDPYKLFTEAPDSFKLLLVQAVFEKLWVIGREVVGSELTDAFHELLTAEAKLTLDGQAHAAETATDALSLDPEAPAFYRNRMALSDGEDDGDDIASLVGRLWVERPRGALPLDRKNPVPPVVEPGSNVQPLVGVTGFEPATSSSRSKVPCSSTSASALVSAVAVSVDVRACTRLCVQVVTQFVTHHGRLAVRAAGVFLPHYHGEVATLEEIEARLAAVEQQLLTVRQDAAAARVLAGAADRDVSEFRQTLSAHTKTLGALRETQVEQGQQLNALERKVSEHQQETRDGFAKVNAGMNEITRLLTRLIEQQPGE
jgi:hypothetical protein